MKRPLVYLAGPINGRSDAEVFDWRKDVARDLAPIADVLDPTVRDFRGREDVSACDIVEFDKKDIDKCDVLLANAVSPSVGTSMEVIYAWSHPMDKIVISVIPRNASPWLIYHSDYVVGTVPEAVQLVRDLFRVLAD